MGAVRPLCKRARGRAPTLESDRHANSFALPLDWSEGGPDVANYWQTLVGVHLTERQTAVLNVVVGAPSVTIRVIETATGLSSDDIVEALDFLVVQVLVEQYEANYRLSQHLLEELG